MIITILTFVIVLSLLVFVHELGHFIMARRMGVKVEEFGFGFPPRIFGFQLLTGQKLEKIAEKEKIEMNVSDYRTEDGQEIIKETFTDKIQEIDRLSNIKKWQIVKGAKLPKKQRGTSGGTIYSLNWIPIGGFVKIKGEQGEKAEEKDSFIHKKIWQRAAILTSGVAMNFILAFLLISIGFGIGIPQVIDESLPQSAKIREPKIQVVQVIDNSPAKEADIKVGDIILSLDNQKINEIKEFQSYTQNKLESPVILKIKRGNEEIEKTLMPKLLDQSTKPVIGVGLLKTGLVRYPIYEAVWQGLKTTVSITEQILIAFYELIKNLIVGQKVAVDVAGPVGIAVLTGQVAKMGIIYILQFTALLSINLAIINFIPFPALDGGRILFLIIEKIKGSAVNRKIEALIHNIGFIILIAIVLFVTLKDISRFSHSIGGFVQKVLGS